MVLCLCIWDDLRGARQLGAEHRATYLYSVDPRDLDHDAVMRIGGRAPERWAHSTRRPESHSWVRVTPPRIVIGCQRHFRCREDTRSRSKRARNGCSNAAATRQAPPVSSIAPRQPTACAIAGPRKPQIRVTIYLTQLNRKTCSLRCASR